MVTYGGLGDPIFEIHFNVHWVGATHYPPGFGYSDRGDLGGLAWGTSYMALR